MSVGTRFIASTCVHQREQPDAMNRVPTEIPIIA